MAFIIFIAVCIGILLTPTIFKKLEAIYGSRKALRFYLVTLIIFLLSSTIIYKFSTTEACKCDNIDDCLSKYMFEEARNYASNLKINKHLFAQDNIDEANSIKPTLFLKIICFESQYWIDQNEMEKAKSSSKELLSLELNGNILMDKYLNLNFEIIKKYCTKKQFDLANDLLLHLPEKNQIDTNFKYYNDNEQEKYIHFRSNLSNNQEIEPWKGEGQYIIYTYTFPQIEAEKIIEKYKTH